MSKSITLTEAEALFAGARSDFESLVTRIERIVATRAWEVLGYDSFAVAWRIHFGDVSLDTPLAKKLVVQQMLSDGLTADAVSLEVKGMGPATVSRIARALAEGVPIEGVSLNKRSAMTPGSDEHVVAPFVRKNPSAAANIHLELGAEKRDEVARCAGSVGQSLNEFALDAINFHVEFVRRGERKSA